MGRRKPTRTRRPRQGRATTPARERTPGDLFPPGTIIQMLADSAARAHTLSLSEGMAHRPSLTGLRAGRIIAMAHTRPLYTGEDAENGIANLSVLASAVDADCVLVSWETCDVQIACDMPLLAPDECLNILVAGEDGEHLHAEFPYISHPLAAPTRTGLQGFRPQWLTPTQRTNSPLLRPIQRAVEQSFAQRAAVAPSGLEAATVWMRAHGYTVSLLDSRPPASAE
ncbi:hypothetical protein AR457_37890 [Streptomyces agglomeratus]|uniref:hypothetical protein n=1 Tax=Streptomyces agglomeratus TaxID=285458 RepID=UPI000853FCE5|nr:hypothetical protein [Streptomyces agglomeratus]OEJ22980.1 hypothetical protein AR457_37890 [Streptomyces agglomeratus]